VEEVFCQTFTAGVPGIGEVRMEPLALGGEEIFVTEDNRREYVDAYVDFYLNRSVQRQFDVREPLLPTSVLLDVTVAGLCVVQSLAEEG
jgi:hypothetical protein